MKVNGKYILKHLSNYEEEKIKKVAENTFQEVHEKDQKWKYKDIVLEAAHVPCLNLRLIDHEGEWKYIPGNPSKNPKDALL